MAVTISSSGSGIGKILLGSSVPFLQISDNYFIFDITPEIVNKLKEYFSTQTFLGNVSIMHLEHHGNIEEFKKGFADLINYAIFKNQILCEKLTVNTTQQDYYDAASEVWPPLARKITKLNERDWPTDSFLKNFVNIGGAGSVSVSREKMDLTNIVSWFFEVTHSTNDDIIETSDITSLYGNDYRRHSITVNDLPINPKSKEWIHSRVKPESVKFPEVKNDSSGDYGYTYRYSVIYYYHSETTTLPIEEMHSCPANNFTFSQHIPQNTISVHMKTLYKVEVKREDIYTDYSGGN